jgi:hypothetical protein
MTKFDGHWRNKVVAPNHSITLHAIQSIRLAGIASKAMTLTPALAYGAVATFARSRRPTLNTGEKLDNPACNDGDDDQQVQHVVSASGSPP